MIVWMLQLLLRWLLESGRGCNGGNVKVVGIGVGVATITHWYASSCYQQPLAAHCNCRTSCCTSGTIPNGLIAKKAGSLRRFFLYMPIPCSS